MIRQIRIGPWRVDRAILVNALAHVLAIGLLLVLVVAAGL